MAPRLGPDIRAAFAPYIEELLTRNAVEEVTPGLVRSEGPAAAH
ncbi:hypothetical protein ACFW5X_06395 [Streptomyces albogriseolus]